MKQVDKSDDSWFDNGGNNSQGQPAKKDDGTFMRLDPRKDASGKNIPYRVRVVANPIKYREHFFKIFFGCTFTNGKPVKKGVVSPAYEIESKDLDIFWSKGDFFPAKKFSVPVIDRDTGEIRLLSGGSDIFDPMMDYQTNAEINIASNEAPDFLITVKEIPGKNGAKATREYSCMVDPKNPRTPFTELEKAQIEAYPEDWTRFWKKQTPAEMEHLWNQLPEDRRYNKNKKEKNTNSFSALAKAANELAKAKAGAATAAPAATTAAVSTTATAAPEQAQPAPAATTAAATSDKPEDLPF